MELEAPETTDRSWHELLPSNDLVMNDDGWYSSFVGKSGKPFVGVQKLVERRYPRRETILVRLLHRCIAKWY
jgi:hypothetical protein